MTSYLHHPLNPIKILQKCDAIKKALLLEKRTLQKKRVAILGGENTKNLTNILELFLLARGIAPIFYESEFNRYYEDAIFGGIGVTGELLNDFEPDLIYIHTNHLNIKCFPSSKDSFEVVEQKYKETIAEYSEIWDALGRFNCPIIQNNFDLPTHRNLGNLECYDQRGKVHFINRLNGHFATQAAQRSELHISDINYLCSEMGFENWYDAKLKYSAGQSIAILAFPRLCQNLSNTIAAVLGLTKKGLVLDLDGTCWGGVIGDDGLENIALGENGVEGKIFQDFQHYIRQLAERGVVLAVCSKNEESNAKSGFQHPGSVLKLTDFASFKANWERKDSNILQIASELNLGLESLVFLDDSEFERQLVNTSLPAVAVPQLSQGVLEYIKHIDQNGYFETVAINEEDLSRVAYYNENQVRHSAKQSFTSLDDYLNYLQMKGTFTPFSRLHMDRIHQLVNKTNQFNLTGNRLNKQQLEAMLGCQNTVTIAASLADRFGENGIVSVITGEHQHGVCVVNNWVMSCRVFQRGFEFAVFDAFVKECKKKCIKQIIGMYNPSSKNGLVKDLYSSLGGVYQGEERGIWKWNLEVSNYQPKSKWITHE